MAVTNCGNGLYKLTAQADALDGTFYIDWIEWVSKGGAAGDDLLIQDADSKDIKAGVASGANYYEKFPVKGMYIDPAATVLDNGIIYIKTKLHPDNI